MPCDPDDDPDSETLPRRVLIVEDEVLLRVTLAEALRARGLTAIEVGDADAAWRYLGAGGQADLIVSDVELPGSMDGLELARRLRADYPAIKVILTSAAIPLKAQGQPGALLPKPYALDDAVSLILETLGGRGR